ncbi:MAG: hypothetical protein NVS9B4_23410 [Candidatus Acidiferrum sp.]
MAKRVPSFLGAGLFAETPVDIKPARATYRANIDGGSRGNPGPASYGVVIRDESGKIVAKLKKYIGRASNNVAEYYGLIAALDYAREHGVGALRVESDSELLVKQMRGQYKVRSEDLRPLFERAKKMSQGLGVFRIDHVYREQNDEADALANEAMDEASGVVPKRSAPVTVAIKPMPASQRTRALYRAGALHPIEELELPEGAEVEIVVKVLPKKR